MNPFVWIFIQFGFNSCFQITMDNSGYFAATSSSDKSLSLYEFDTGECMATMSGHSGDDDDDNDNDGGVGVGGGDDDDDDCNNRVVKYNDEQ